MIMCAIHAGIAERTCILHVLLQIDPPADWETYIHRSGRTGRAGQTGTCVTLVTKKMEYMVPIIEVGMRV
jgi:superfamily II DNA/RNA helicase